MFGLGKREKSGHGDAAAPAGGAGVTVSPAPPGTVDGGVSTAGAGRRSAAAAAVDGGDPGGGSPAGTVVFTGGAGSSSTSSSAVTVETPRSTAVAAGGAWTGVGAADGGFSTVDRGGTEEGLEAGLRTKRPPGPWTAGSFVVPGGGVRGGGVSVMPASMRRHVRVF
jgi:hypothetical protein